MKLKLDHDNVSFMKSGLRVGAGIALITANFVVAGILLIVAEGLGVLEEIV